MYRTFNTEVEIDVYELLDDISDTEISEYLKFRDMKLRPDTDEARDLVTAIYEKRRLGKSFDAELDKLISCVI